MIDFHLHLASREREYPWVRRWLSTFRETSGVERVLGPDGVAEPEAMERLLEEAGVDYGVILAEYSPICVGTVTNEYVAEFCAKSRRLIPFCNINPHLVTDPATELRRCVLDLGCQGLKLHPPHQHFYANDRRLYRLYATAEEFQIPVLIHTGSSVFKGSRVKYADPLFVDDVAVDFPDLPLVLAHGGRGFWYDQAFFLAQLHENVSLEISGLPPKNLLQYFPRLERIAHKVIFGSDWPGVPGIGVNIEAL
ncbi:MAG: amidohydrolase, partial [candidate division NC10 bacterium]|nr:amidohydrolase [candidate division NC10 bacterium]